jgi:uncharacterized Zn-binding protein involved in type VI secretion
MTYGVAVQNLDYAGGQQLIEVNDWHLIEGKRIVVLGDLVESHGSSPHSPPPPMVQCSDWYFVGGIGVCREGHLAACGHATTGRPWYRISS